MSAPLTTPIGSIDAALQLYELVGAVVGVYIAALAYRGYRRNDSRPMLFIAVGFGLVLGLPLVLTPIFLLVPTAGLGPAFQALIQTIEIVGLLCIVYALRL